MVYRWTSSVGSAIRIEWVELSGTVPPDLVGECLLQHGGVDGIQVLLKDPAELLPQWMPRLQHALRQRPAALGAVTFHPPCSFSHVLKLSQANQPGPVETHLRALGFDVKLAKCDSHQCCGAGGAYSVLQPELSRQLWGCRTTWWDQVLKHNRLGSLTIGGDSPVCVSCLALVVS